MRALEAIQRYCEQRDQLADSAMEKALQAEEINDGISSKLELFDERSMQIGGSGLDLSCLKPINDVEAIHALSYLAEHAPDLQLYEPGTNIYDAKFADDKKAIVGVILNYRNIALNSLIGLQPEYEKMKKIIDEMIKENPYPMARQLDEFNDSTLEWNAFPFSTALTRICTDMANDFRYSLHEIWAPMFDDRIHKKLATEYLDKKINQEELVQTFQKMKQPTFKHLRPRWG